MLRYRKLLVTLIDLIMVALLIWALNTGEDRDDFYGFFILFFIGFIISFNLYALLVYFLFRQIKPKKIAIEVGFFLLMLLPFYFLYRFTHN